MVAVFFNQSNLASAVSIVVPGCNPAPGPLTPLDDLAQVALELIAEFGKLVEFISPGTETYDKVAGKRTEYTPMSTFLKAVPPRPARSGYKAQTESRKEYTYQTMIAAEGTTYVPEEGHTMRLECNLYTIVVVDRIYSGELTAAYKLGLKR